MFSGSRAVQIRLESSYQTDVRRRLPRMLDSPTTADSSRESLHARFETAAGILQAEGYLVGRRRDLVRRYAKSIAMPPNMAIDRGLFITKIMSAAAAINIKAITFG